MTTRIRARAKYRISGRVWPRMTSRIRARAMYRIRDRARCSMRARMMSRIRAIGGLG